MLTTPTPVPQNSTSPLPANWGQRQAPSLYNLFAAGLTVPPQVACAPTAAAFQDVSPAGVLFPVVVANPAQPALSTAVLSPAPVSPLAAQVYQTQQSMQQGLTSNNAQLGPATDVAGQSGATADPSAFVNAAQVYPMSLTQGLVEQRIPVGLRRRQKGPPNQPGFPGAPWGGASVRIPGGGCGSSVPSGWALLFLGLGAALIIGAAAK